MINSLCGSMGSLNSENSCTKLQQSTSPTNNKSILDSRKGPLSSDFESNSLVPSSLNLNGLKFDIDGDVDQVQSPDSCSMWDSFFTDQFDSDFMISSPVRSSPMNYSHNYVQSMQGQSLLGCSPPGNSSQIGSSSSNIQRGKGQSPLHKVFNSPTYQYIQPDTLSLPPLETLLDDYSRDGVGASSSSYPMMQMPAAGLNLPGASTLGQYMDMPVTIHPGAAMGLPLQNSSRFCGSVSESSATGGGSQLTQENDIYQMGSMASPAPLSQQLQQEHRQEQQLQQTQRQLQEIHNVHRTLMMPHPHGSDQVSYLPILICYVIVTC